MSWSCPTGKEGFRTHAAAARVARRIDQRRSKNRKSDRAPPVIYRCQHCGEFHLTVRAAVERQAVIAKRRPREHSKRWEMADE